MEEYEEKLLKKIDEDICSNADLVEKRVEAETAHLHDKQVALFKQSLDKEIGSYLDSELKDLQNLAASKSSRDRLATKKKLLELREQLVTELFDDVKNDLQKFTEGDGYADYLRKNLAMTDLSGNGYFDVRKEDTVLMKKMLAEIHHDGKEIRNAYLPIGGYKYVDEENKMEYSCLLDEKRQNEFQWFRDNSGFEITESEAEK
jgi:vacuolar-type H+-ATPase subunit E/Vma4